MNETTIISSSYDQHGAILYTIVVLLFYSLSLFCTLILNIDPDDHFYEEKWRIYQKRLGHKTFHSDQSKILNHLSDEKRRECYWKIYYGDENSSTNRPSNFLSNEMKRLSLVTKRMKELNIDEEQHELDELSRHSNGSSEEILFDFRRKIPFRTRSTSVPGIDPQLVQAKSRRLSSNFHPKIRRLINQRDLIE